MTELEKAARMALEALEELQGVCTDAPGGVEAVTIWTPEAITALTQALVQCHAAQTELGAVRWELCKHCGHDMKEPCHHNANPNAARNCRWNREDTRVLGTGLVNNRPTPQQSTPSTGNILMDAFKQMPALKQPATTERKGEPIGEIVRSFGTGSGLEVRLFGGLTSDTPGIIGTKLYTSPQVPEGFALVPVDFLRGFRTLAHNYSLTAEPPFYYRGIEASAFSEAYRRCGEDLARLRAMLDAARKGERCPRSKHLS